MDAYAVYAYCFDLQIEIASYFLVEFDIDRLLSFPISRSKHRTIESHASSYKRKSQISNIVHTKRKIHQPSLTVFSAAVIAYFLNVHRV